MTNENNMGKITNYFYRKIIKEEFLRMGMKSTRRWLNWMMEVRDNL